VGYHWLVGIAAINSTVSLYYYLKIIRQVYIEEVQEGDSKWTINPMIRGVVTSTCIAVIILGVVPYFYETINLHTSSWLKLF